MTKQWRVMRMDFWGREREVLSPLPREAAEELAGAFQRDSLLEDGRLYYAVPVRLTVTQRINRILNGRWAS